MAIQLSKALFIGLADWAIAGWCRRDGASFIEDRERGLLVDGGLVQEEEIAKFVYLLNSFIAP